MVTAIGMTEPTAGSDLQALRTSARRNGDDWIINGSKTFVTNGATADLVVVAARTSRRGISLFGVEAEMTGSLVAVTSPSLANTRRAPRSSSSTMYVYQTRTGSVRSIEDLAT